MAILVRRGKRDPRLRVSFGRRLVHIAAAIKRYCIAPRLGRPAGATKLASDQSGNDGEGFTLMRPGKRTASEVEVSQFP